MNTTWILPAALALTLAYVQWQLPRFRDRALLFWRQMRIALLAWLALEGSALLVSERGIEERGGAALFLAALFATLVIAVDGQPHHAAAPRVRITDALERVGSLVFAFGLWLYATADGSHELGLRCLLLLLLLYLLARLWHWSRARPALNWRVAYRMLALGAVLAAVSVAGPLLLEGRAAAFLSLLWLAVPAAIVAALLASSAAPAGDLDDDEAERPAAPPEPLVKLWSGPLTGYAMAFAVLHLAGYSLGLLDPEAARPRAVLALVLLLGLGALALWQHKELMRRADDTQRMYERSSQFDAFTGLASRASFVERVSRSLERSKRVPGYQFAVLVVELERFKLIENAYGPRFAREIVVGLSERLKKCLRPADMIATLGIDRFAVLADHIRPGQAARDLGVLAQRIGGSVLSPSFGVQASGEHGSLAAEIAERILRDAVSPPIAVEEREIYPRGSIGIATSAPAYADADEMLRDAQAAARRAKQRGGDTFEIFDPDMQAESLARVLVESQLHHAVERGELLLVYQPVVRLVGGGIEGFEALIRWRHPTRGLLSPAQFLAAADTTGLIVPMTRFVLREACRGAVAWQRLAGRPIFVSCNIGGPEFHVGGRLREAAREALADSGLAGAQLKLEITEGVAIASFDAVRREIEGLNELGVDFLLDDFGTGYSSLSYLHRLPVRGIKIDRSFVESLPGDGGATALVRGIVELAKELQRDVIAEGVETRAQWDSLRSLGCVFGQGYHFGRPLLPEELGPLLQGTPH
jgi:diguanylate cyclase (GGDEF)-like protein